MVVNKMVTEAGITRASTMTGGCRVLQRKGQGGVRKSLIRGGFLEVIQHEHRLGRQKTSEIQKTFFQYSINQACLDDVLNSCIEYVEMLRQHIYKEDRLLFPLSDRIMDKEDQ
jgi:hemerythrin-like domain-containing protein